MSKSIVRLKWFVIAIAIAAPAVYLWSGRTTPQTAPPSKPNILIYMVDTLRRDHLTVYGYERRTSPNLEVFRKDSVLFQNAYTPAPWTRPATASLLSGLLPRKHGAVSKLEKIHDDVKLISQYLQQAGYGTACFSTNPHVLPIWGFDRGFDLFQEIRKGNAEKVVQKVVEQIPRFRQKPFFFYIHTLDPHGPNKAPEPFRGMWPRTFKMIKTSDIDQNTPADVVEDTITAYDEEIARNDHYFGVLMDFLKQEGLYKDTLIFYVSDHGEEFQDHGSGGHCHTMYQELVHIPMLMKLPGNQHANEEVEDRVWLLDVVPTILSLVNQNRSVSPHATNLLQFVGKNSHKPPRTLFFDLDMERVDSTPYSMRAVLSGNLKYTERSLPWKERQLFDLARDPKEKQNIFEEKRNQAEMLAQKIQQNILENEGGVYLRFSNAQGHGPMSYHGELTTEAQFKDVRSWQFDPGDSLEIAPDSKSLKFSVELKNTPDPSRFASDPSADLIDEDVICLRVEPPDAKIVLTTLSCSGCSERGIHIGQSRKLLQSLPVLIEQRNNELIASGSSEKFKSTGLHLFVVPFQKASEVQLDGDTVERLRALGYVQ